MNPDAEGPPPRRKIALALQGGGSHGALSWGILDRLLEEPDLDIIGISGTSAGAMNAVVMADGLVKGGAEQARRSLRTFWERIGRMPGFGSMVGPMSGETAARLRIEHTPAYMFWDMLSRNLSPYDINPAGYNPLRAPLLEQVDFERLRNQDDVKVMVCATNVHTARRRVFANKDMSVDAVLASACLPQLFPAVEIDGESYWDGGYTGNPAMFPLAYRMPACDIVIVRVDPIKREQSPRSVHDIADRVREISFNSAFWLEMSAMAVILRLVDAGHLDRERFGRFRFHAIEASDEMEKLASSSKLNNYLAFLEYLFAIGRTAADDWIAAHRADIGKRSTIKIQKLVPLGEESFGPDDLPD